MDVVAIETAEQVQQLFDQKVFLISRGQIADGGTGSALILARSWVIPRQERPRTQPFGILLNDFTVAAPLTLNHRLIVDWNHRYLTITCFLPLPLRSRVFSEVVPSLPWLSASDSSIPSA